MKKIVLFLSLALSISINASAGTVAIQKLYIDWNKGVHQKNFETKGAAGSGMCSLGYNNVIGSENQIGILTGMDKNQNIIFKLPVSMKLRSGGVTVGCEMVMNDSSTLMNWNNKNLSDVLGMYAGIKIGAAVLLQPFVRHFSSVNRQGVYFADGAGTMGIAVDLSVAVISLESYTDSVFTADQAVQLQQFIKETRLLKAP